MKTITTHLLSFRFWKIALLGLLINTGLVCGADVIVVANSSASFSSVSASDLENVFLGKTRSLGDDKIKPVTLKSGPAHEAFLSQYVQKSSSQFASYWKRKVVQGTGIPPKSFSSDAELIAHIKNNPGTIGYVSDTADSTGLKTISVE